VGVVDLANAALSPQPTVTHALRRLEDRGLVVRKHGPDDRRQRLVSITPNGTQLAATLTAEAKALEAEQLADAGELTDLINRLRDLTSTLEATAQLRAATADRTG
jgi:DNA-binding MarR family transcriptional regulator